MSPPRKAPAAKSVFVCSQCGDDQPRWFGRCPACGAWNSAAERRLEPEATARAAGATGTGRRGAWASGPSGPEVARPLAEVSLADAERIPTGFPEVDRVLGGGLVPGALLLLCGDPGIGKSTLALQVARRLADPGRRVLYLSGEESPEQVRLRAERLGKVPPQLYVLCETDLTRALEVAAALEPGVLVVDSIQTLAADNLPAASGSVAQVKECALGLLGFAKGRRVPTVLVGHVTKDGAAAGPRVLEHMVDAVLYLDGERFHQVRLLRAAKNRFGSTSELGVFEMTDGGLAQMRDPAQVFLGESDGREAASGSVHVVAMQGTRPLVVEVQALVTASGFAVPQRAGTGVHPKRLAVLLAVLEKRLGMRLSHADVFVNVAGGLRLEEPSADLGLALAIAGSRHDRPSRGRLVALGEVGLGGEVRRVHQLVPRVREAVTLGFSPIVVPASQLEEIEGVAPDAIGVRTLAEALEAGLGPKRRPSSAEPPGGDAPDEEPRGVGPRSLSAGTAIALEHEA